MPRFPRKFIKTSFFHVITQGINKIYIFDKSEDIKYYIKTMYKLLREHNLKIIAYCIMNNHAHILFETDDINELSKYMQRLNTKYARYYNQKYNRVGYVFRDRFKSEGIYSEEQLYNCIRYIYNNPIKAGMCSNPSEYPYSNYKSSNCINDNTTDAYFFMDIEEDNEKLCEETIKKFLKDNYMEFKDLKEKKNKLKELITILYEKNYLSFRKIGRKLELNKDIVRKIYYL